MAGDDMGERTEEATPRRRTEARSSGNVARSQDLAGAMMLLAVTILTAVVLFPVLGQFKVVLEAVLSGDTLGSPIDPGHAVTVISYVAVAAARIAAPLLLVVLVVAIVSHFVQVGWLFSTKALMPTLNKLNPLTGFRRIFGLSGLVKVLMDSAKVIVVLTVVVLTLMQYRERVLVLGYFSVLQGLHEAGWLVFILALRLVVVLLLLGVLDFYYHKWKHNQDLKMTKHQVKDEMKMNEGDPEVKKRRFRMQQQISMQRVSAAVPKADVVVTNPEHVSVAIQYDAERMHAPTVVAKGADFLALRIRQIALMRGIPIVQRPPLARALYRQVGVNQEIPTEFYHAVAEILAHVYRLQGRMAG